MDFRRSVLSVQCATFERLRRLRFTSPDGDSYTLEDNSFNTVLKNDAGDYLIEFPEGVSSVQDGFEIMHYTRIGPSGATVVKFAGLGNVLEPAGANRTSNLSNLRQATTTSYLVDGGDLWVKFFSSSQRVSFTTATANNRTPIAINDSGMTAIGQPVTIDVLDNDFDPDGDPLRVIPVGTVRGNFVADFQTPVPPSGWEYVWNASGQFGDEATYESLEWDTWRYRPTGLNFPYIGATFAHPGQGTAQDPAGIERFAIAAFTVPQSGIYAISDSLLDVNTDTLDGVNVKVHVSGGSVMPLGEFQNAEGDFDATLGYLYAGTKIYVGLGSNSTAGADGTDWGFSIVRADAPSNGTLQFNPMAPLTMFQSQHSTVPTPFSTGYPMDAAVVIQQRSLSMLLNPTHHQSPSTTRFRHSKISMPPSTC